MAGAIEEFAAQTKLRGDVDDLTKRGVVVTNTPDVLTETTADFGFALLVATVRKPEIVPGKLQFLGHSIENLHYAAALGPQLNIFSTGGAVTPTAPASRTASSSTGRRAASTRSPIC